MLAIVAHAAKDIRVENIDAREPGPDEVQVQIERGGICGSDLHYFNHGGFGTVRLKEPMILGHEVSGRVTSVGRDVKSVKANQLVAVSPSRPCGNCEYCYQGIQHHCFNMRFYGSAMPFPHIQGAFRQTLIAHENQCIVADSLTAAEAAMAEPLAVVIHAARQAQNLIGKRVLVTGCGPIGLLCIMVALRSGAQQVIATDISAAPLKTALAIGALDAINVGDSLDAKKLDAYAADKGYFDTHFECTGVAAALAQAIPMIKPRGVIVQVGLGGDMTLPVQQLTAKEIEMRGSFRFHEEFAVGVSWMQNKMLDVTPLITHTYKMEQAEQAFVMASDSTASLKVQLDLSV